MKLIVDQFETNPGEDTMFQIRSYDCGILSALVGTIREMICDVTVPKENPSVGAGLKELGNTEFTLSPVEKTG